MKKPILGTITIPVLCVCLSTPLSASSVGESAGEIWIDGPDQPGVNPIQPDADVDKTGRSIFVWEATASGNQKDIFLRVFPADGSNPSDPMQVNTYDDDAQHSPKVAINDDGSFLVAWLSEEEPEGGGSLRPVVRSQAFDVNANPVGNEQLLSTLDLLVSVDKRFDLDVLPSGEYIVVWRSNLTPEPQDSSVSIQGRRIGANGVPVADQFQVNSTMTSTAERYPAVTSLSDGGFLVVWTEPQVHGRRFRADFTPVGNDFQINTFITGRESRTVVDRNADGRVLVVWQDEEEPGDEAEIRARLYSPELVPIGEDFRINTETTDGQREPKVAEYGKGGFFVVWQSRVSADNDVEPGSIEGRIVTADNQFASPQFLVNSWILDNQEDPGMGGKNGRVAIGWKSSSNPATTDNVIQGQFWSNCGISCDDIDFPINAGLNDAWYSPATNGQGFFITVFPNIKQMFLAWFTFDTERPPEGVTALLGEPGHRWLTGQGAYQGDTANLTIFVTQGGVFDSAEPTATSDPAGDGVMTIEFADCTEGLVTYEISSLGITGEIPIQRVVSDNVALCETLAFP